MSPPPSSRAGPGVRFAVGMLRLYKRFLSPLLPPACRFEPTCSEYARLAIVKHGLRGGVPKALWRLLRCNPLSTGGIDLP